MTVPIAAAAAEATPEEIARASGSSFLVSFRFLGRERRAALTALYAFCRLVDDAADDAPNPEAGRQALDAWRQELARCEGGAPETKVGQSLQRAMQQFGVRRRDLDDLIAGCAMDLDGTVYETPEDLEVYCYRVASAVGLACLPVFGAHSEAAQEYGIALGRALQWTNILRDLRGDAMIGRIYAPRSWMEDEGVDEAMLRGDGPEWAYAPTGPMDDFVECFVRRAQGHFADARRLMPADERRLLLPSRIMGAIYGELLEMLWRRGGEIRGPRLRVRRARKAWLALRTWLGRR